MVFTLERQSITVIGRFVLFHILQLKLSWPRLSKSGILIWRQKIKPLWDIVSAAPARLCRMCLLMCLILHPSAGSLCYGCVQFVCMQANLCVFCVLQRRPLQATSVRMERPVIIRWTAVWTQVTAVIPSHLLHSLFGWHIEFSITARLWSCSRFVFWWHCRCISLFHVLFKFLSDTSVV